MFDIWNIIRILINYKSLSTSFQVPLSVKMVSQTTVLKSALEILILEFTIVAVTQDTRLILQMVQCV